MAFGVTRVVLAGCLAFGAVAGIVCSALVPGLGTPVHRVRAHWSIGTITCVVRHGYTYVELETTTLRHEHVGDWFVQRLNAVSATNVRAPLSEIELQEHEGFAAGEYEPLASELSTSFDSGYAIMSDDADTTWSMLIRIAPADPAKTLVVSRVELYVVSGAGLTPPSPPYDTQLVHLGIRSHDGRCTTGH